MSNKIVYVSRVGFGACPSCGTHVKLEESRADTTCPSCSNQFGNPVAPGTRSILAGAQSVLGGRSGFLVASLIAASPLVACESDKSSDDSGDAYKAATEPEPCSDYGCSSDEGFDTSDGMDEFDSVDGSDDTIDGSDDSTDGSDDSTDGSDDSTDGSDGTIDGSDGTIDGSDGTIDGSDGTDDGADTTDASEG